MRKKTLIIILISIFLLSGTSINGVAGEVYAWDDCPMGMVNDEYPGSCPRYVDTDKNGICDHSEPAPEDRAEYQESNKVITDKQTENPITPTNNNETKNISSKNVIILLSIFMPLTALVGYASVYKIKQSKKL